MRGQMYVNRPTVGVASLYGCLYPLQPRGGKGTLETQHTRVTFRVGPIQLSDTAQALDLWLKLMDSNAWPNFFWLHVN